MLSSSKNRTAVRLNPKDLFLANFINEKKLKGQPKEKIFQILVDSKKFLEENEINADDAFHSLYIPSAYNFQKEQELTEDEMTRINDEQVEFEQLFLKLK